LSLKHSSGRLYCTCLYCLPKEREGKVFLGKGKIVLNFWFYKSVKNIADNKTMFTNVEVVLVDLKMINPFSLFSLID
jgi:hypothetical protein